MYHPDKLNELPWNDYTARHLFKACINELTHVAKWAGTHHRVNRSPLPGGQVWVWDYLLLWILVGISLTNSYGLHTHRKSVPTTGATIGTDRTMAPRSRQTSGLFLVHHNFFPSGPKLRPYASAQRYRHSNQPSRNIDIRSAVLTFTGSTHVPTEYAV